MRQVLRMPGQVGGGNTYSSNLQQQQSGQMGDRPMANISQGQVSPMMPQGRDSAPAIGVYHNAEMGGGPGGMRPVPGGGQPGTGSNGTVNDYRHDLESLEMQNKKRLKMARQEQDNMSGMPRDGPNRPGGPTPGPNGRIIPERPPQGARSGASPSPQDQMKRGTPQMGNNMGSPHPDGAQSRGSPKKSSIALAIFWPLKAERGNVMVDGVDIASIHPKRLQQGIAIVLQEAAIFTDMLQFNLDLSNDFNDDEIPTALRSVHFVGADEAIDLSSPAAEVLQGRKQLVCLACAILRKPTVLIMDEATALLDHATKAKVQETIRELKCTVITRGRGFEIMNLLNVWAIISLSWKASQYSHFMFNISIGDADEFNLLPAATHVLHEHCRHYGVDVVILEGIGQRFHIGVVHRDDGALELCFQRGWASEELD